MLLRLAVDQASTQYTIGSRPQITINGTRWIERFREALASPTRDDGSLKSEPRKQ